MSVPAKKPPLEKVIVNQIVKALKVNGVIWVWKTHGGPYQTSGVPDILCIAPGTGRFVGIEVKRPGGYGKPTELQLHQIELIRQAGGVAGIATSVDEALALVREAEEKNYCGIFYLPVDELLPACYQHIRDAADDDKIDKTVECIARAIQQFGFTVPVILNGKHEIVSGHLRILAAHTLGLASVPCAKVKDDSIVIMTEDQWQEWRRYNEQV